MEVLYIHTDIDDDRFESFSVEPSKYGGHIIPRFLKEEMNKNGDVFHLYGDPRSFLDLKDYENKACCFSLSKEARAVIGQGAKIKDYIPNANRYDLIFHGNCSQYLNAEGIKAKNVVWSLGYLEKVHPDNKNVLFFNYKLQKPKIVGNPRIYNIVIGPKLPKFQEYVREDFLLLVSRQNELQGTPILIELCLKYNIPLILAGKCDKGYEWVEKYRADSNSRIKWLGELPQLQKLELTKKAAAVAILHNWHSPSSLLSIEAQHLGCPLIVTGVGWWPSYIRQENNINGFIVHDENEFIAAYQNCKKIKQIDCYNAAKEYNSDRMVETCRRAFEEILQ